MAMTMTTILVVSAIASAFLVFGGVLAWGDFYSNGARQQANAPDQPAPRRSAEPPEHRKAA
jgi:hypothetical protein